MHLPDGFLSVPVSGALIVASGAAVGVALRRVGQEQQAADSATAQGAAPPLMGVTAAFIFTAQMFNFPVAAGTTGHLLGAALATALLGPWRAIVAMAVVLVIQTVFFADGGWLAVGANTFNMGVAGCLLSGVLLPVLVKATGNRASSRPLALAVAAWCSVMLAAFLTAVQIGISGTIPLGTVVPAMLAVHAVIGVGEAVLSVAAWGVLAGARPDLVGQTAEQPWAATASQGAEPWRLAAVLALGLVTVALAAPHPDGLERVAEDLAFIEQAAPGAAAPLPDYAFPRAEGDETEASWFETYFSAVVGGLICAALMLAVGGGFRRQPTPLSDEPPTETPGAAGE